MYCRLFSYALLFIFSSLHSQSLKPAFTENVDMQWIVRLDDHTSIDILKSKIPASALRHVAFKQLMHEPLQLWLIEVPLDHQSEVVHGIKDFRGTQSIHKNRIISSRKTPDDPRLSQQWQYNNDGLNGGVAGADMEMYKAWNFTTGGVSISGDTIVVCVIDDGINGNHPDMKENMWVNHMEIPNNGIDDDANGYIDDYRGWNIATSNDDVWSGGGHGTPVAGIIGAKGNNGLGVSGVNWNIKLMAVDYGSANEANALAAYGYAYSMRKLYNESKGQKGAYIVATNASWGVNDAKAEDAPLWCDLYDKLGELGIMNVAATTNNETDVDTDGDLPTTCTSEFLISVTNLNKSDIKQTAGYGRKSIDLGAYGHQAYTVTRSDYGTFGGTSGATPHVTGVVALLYSIPCEVFDSIVKSNPSGAALIVKDMILHGTENINSLEGITTTNGKLNAFRSVSNLSTLCMKNAPPAGIIIDADDEKVKISWIRGDEASVKIRYRKLDALDWIILDSFANGDTIGGLDFCTEYEVQIGSKLGLLPSEFSYSKFFTTAGCCTLPQIRNIVTTDEIISFDWFTSADATLNITYRPFESVDTLSVFTTGIFTLDSLAKCKAYVFNVQAQCTKYGNESPVSGDIIISTSCDQCTALNYCDLIVDNKEEWIESVGIDGDEFVSQQGAGGYNSFAGAKEYVLKADSIYNITLTPGYKGTAYSEYFYVFIDYNQDGIWTADERIFYTPEGVRESVTGQFEVPNDSKLGYTRMRVMMSYDTLSGACDQTKLEFGEVEDFCVQIIAPNCIFDNTLKSVASLNSLKFYVESPLQPQDSIQLYYREVGSSEYLISTFRDTLIINELKKCTEYEYYIEANCSDASKFVSDVKKAKTLCIDNTENIFTNIKVFPNPTWGDLLISLDGKGKVNTNDIIIKDLVGKIYFPAIRSIDENGVHIDLQNLPSGVYLMHYDRQIEYKHHAIKIVKL